MSKNSFILRVLVLTALIGGLLFTGFVVSASPLPAGDTLTQLFQRPGALLRSISGVEDRNANPQQGQKETPEPAEIEPIQAQPGQVAATPAEVEDASHHQSQDGITEVETPHGDDSVEIAETVTATEEDLPGSNHDQNDDGQKENEANDDHENGMPAAGEDNPSNEIEFSGTLTSMNGDILMIDGKNVVISKQTEIKGSLQVGSLVEVKGFKKSDGSFTASQIKVEDTAQRNDHQGGDASQNGGNQGGTGSGTGSGGSSRGGHDDGGGRQSGGHDGGGTHP